MTANRQKLLYSDRIVDRDEFREKYLKHADSLELARTQGLVPTAYLVEALEYHYRAERLQKRALGLLPPTFTTGDLLQDNVPIYDTVQRRYAGFSNVLDQLWYGPSAPKYNRFLDLMTSHGYPTQQIGPNLTPKQWLYLALVHRVTGSGASFMRDHGWRNTIVPYMAQAMVEVGLREALKTLRQHYEAGPIFTSLGNQIPSFNKPSKPEWRTGGIEYLHDIAPFIASDMVDWLLAQPKAVPIQEAVDYALDLNTKYGWRRFKFVLTAWVLDIAEYYPHLVDPKSDCYHGANAIETMRLIFDPKASKFKGQKFFDKATRFLSDLTNTNSGDVEDCFCDVVRWVENFIPKKHYEHLDRAVIKNSSSLLPPPSQG